MLGAGFEKERNFDDEIGGRLAALFGELCPTLADTRVEDRFQARLGIGILKNQAPDRSAVGLAVGCVGFSEKLGGDAASHFRVMLEEFARGGVCIEQTRSSFSANIFEKVDLPDPMPPVTPMTAMCGEIKRGWLES